MGHPFNNVRFGPFSQATYGLFKGASLTTLQVFEGTPLGLMTFGFLISDEYSDCGPTVTTSFSACPAVATSWTDE